MQTINHSETLKHTVPGLFAVINTSKKKVEVRYASNINKAIAVILEEIKANTHNTSEISQDFRNEEVSFLYLEEIAEPQTQRLRQAYWISYYENLGYQFYRKKLALVLRPITRIETYQNECFITVRLQNRHWDSFCVGVFKSHQEANEFKEQFYPNNTCQTVVYSLNIFTKKYIEFQRENPWDNPIQALL